jgi:hypothetical protein
LILSRVQCRCRSLGVRRGRCTVCSIVGVRGWKFRVRGSSAQIEPQTNRRLHAD